MSDKDPLYRPTGEDDTPVVYKVIGAPGTGKTTRVVGNPELDLDGLFIKHLQYYDVDEQMIVTYTNAGVDEAADRIEKMLNVPQYKIEERVTTIHSECCSILGVSYENIVDHYTKQTFCKLYDLDYGWDDDDEDIMGADLDEGNALFRIYGWLKSNRMALEAWEKCPIEWAHDEDPLYLMKEWEDWKDKNDYIGFSDMIEQVIELGYEQLENLGWGVLFPDDSTTTREMFEAANEDPQRDPDAIRGKGAFIDTKVLYVDEVQDLTPLQWEWYLLQKLVCEKVFIGGDDDQTIYGWAGADPELMLNEEGDFEVLDQTYRISENIWDVCDGVINQVDVRQEKEVTPAEEGGEVVNLRAPSARQIVQHLQDGSCMVLFRANYMIDEFRDKLHEYGIPYDNMSTYDTWSDDIVTLRNALAKIENGESSIKGHELDKMMEYIDDRHVSSSSGMSETEKVMGNLGGISIDRVREVFNLSTGYGEEELNAANYLKLAKENGELNWYEKQAILGNIKEGNEEMLPSRVRIGTIHSAKGKEAETVVLATDTTQTILDEMAKEVYDEQWASSEKSDLGPTPITDAERRVYYVGMTRASQKLVLAQGILQPDMAIDLDSLLDQDSAAENWESEQSSYGTTW